MTTTSNGNHTDKTFHILENNSGRHSSHEIMCVCYIMLYVHNSSYYHHQIGIINLSHCFHIFPWRCACGGCTIICCRFHMYISRDIWVLLLLLLCSLMMCTNNQTYYRLFAHHTTSLSKMLVRYILSTVCLWLSQFLQLTFMQYMELCELSLSIYLMIIVRIRVLVCLSIFLCGLNSMNIVEMLFIFARHVI